MIIAHLPAGYLLAHGLSKWRVVRDDASRKFAALSLLAGSIFPDIDLLYFHFVDGRANHHHTYWTHLPIFWLIVFACLLPALWITGRDRAFKVTSLFGLGILLHLLLDTVAGKIWWLYPFVDQPYTLLNIPSVQPFWLMNFVFHWSFLAELLIVTWAGLVFMRHGR